MINTTSERFKARNFFICLYFSFYEQLNFFFTYVGSSHFFVQNFDFNIFWGRNFGGYEDFVDIFGGSSQNRTIRGHFHVF